MARIDLSLVSSSSGVFPSRSRWRAAGQRDGRIEVPRSGLLGGVVLPIHMTSSAAVLDEVTHKFCRRPILSAVLTFLVVVCWHRLATDQPAQHWRVSQQELANIAAEKEETHVEKADWAWYRLLARSRNAYLLCASEFF